MPFGKGGEVEPVVIDLGVGDGPNSGAGGSNAAMDVAGWTGTTQSSQNSQVVLWSGGELVLLGFLPGDTSSNAKAVNRHQQVVGVSRSGPFEDFRGFLWQHWTMIELVPPPEYALFSPHCIADGGAILGSLVSFPASHNTALWIDGDSHSVIDLFSNPAGADLAVSGRNQ